MAEPAPKTPEKVLVIPAERLDMYLRLFKDSHTSDAYVVGQLMEEVVSFGRFMDREAAEKNPAFKQIIPYCVFKSGDDYLSYQRTKKGGEQRLHNKFSLGVGGHINPIDGNAKVEASYYAGIIREMKEEVDLDFSISYRPRPIAAIYDPSNDVGKVHLGFVHMIYIHPADRSSLKFEESMSSTAWNKASELRKVGEFETWSQVLVDNVIRG